VGFSRKFFWRLDLLLVIQGMCCTVVRKVTCRVKYLHTMNGTAVARIVVLRPIVSIKGPPAIPPNRADSGIRLPIHDFWKRQMYRWRHFNEPCTSASGTPSLHL
jgi:hypothetical protein